MTQKIQISTAKAEGMTGRKMKRKIIASDIDIHTNMECNKIHEWTYYSLIIIPIWFDTQDRELYDDNDVFRIAVAFNPKKRGFTFNPSDVLLNIQGSKHYPVKYIGPLSFQSTEHEEWARRLAIRGDIVWPGTYGEYHLGNIQYLKITDENIALNNLDIWTGFYIVFDTKIPSPEQAFYLDILGLKKNSREYNIPRITFEKDFVYPCHSCP
jgi:hypothetical protein